jgi:uncharacterized protein (DUF1501 family)
MSAEAGNDRQGKPLLLTRRAALLGLAGTLTLGRASLALAAAATEQRFVVVILRGALDGLSAVQPYGDPALAGLRGELALAQPGREKGLLDIGGYFGLHPSLAGLHGMFKAGELAVAHAVAGPYRSRSHFEAQDYLESGADHRMTSGWLNRVAGLLPAPKSSGRPGSETALSVGATVALLLRGPAPVGSWLPQSFGQPEASLYRAVAALHRGDPVTGPAITEALRERGFSESVLAGTQDAPRRYAFPALAGAAGKLMADADGPRIAALELGGWDTHAAQLARLAGVLRELDSGLVELKKGLGPAWRRTVVLVMTEFGRTVAVNGTRGTDHGTGGVAFIAGGAVAGGRVLGTWPGLGAGKLYVNRDLAPTTDLRSVAKGLLAGHLGLDAGGLAGVFPDSSAAAPMAGLLRA